MKIGILGGSFNPPHEMHKNIAIDLIKNNYVDKVIYVPTGDSYNKKGLISFRDRINMLKEMIQGHDKLEISLIADQPDYEYTYQVLDYYDKPTDDIYFICGSDNLKEFTTWKNYQYILKKYHLLVIPRNDDNIDKIIEDNFTDKDNIIITNITTNNISSTRIRKDIRKNSQYLDEKVKQYILKNKLYMEGL